MEIMRLVEDGLKSGERVVVDPPARTWRWHAHRIRAAPGA